ncbi:hypothetical protein ABH916_004405 [Peribacillus frigoritolerans]
MISKTENLKLILIILIMGMRSNMLKYHIDIKLLTVKEVNEDEVSNK